MHDVKCMLVLVGCWKGLEMIDLMSVDGCGLTPAIHTVNHCYCGS